MFIGKYILMVDDNNINLSPATDIESLYFEQIHKEGSNMEVNQKSVAKHLAVLLFNNIDKSLYVRDYHRSGVILQLIYGAAFENLSNDTSTYSLSKMPIGRCSVRCVDKKDKSMLACSIKESKLKNGLLTEDLNFVNLETLLKHYYTNDTLLDNSTKIANYVNANCLQIVDEANNVNVSNNEAFIDLSTKNAELNNNSSIRYMQIIDELYGPFEYYYKTAGKILSPISIGNLWPSFYYWQQYNDWKLLLMANSSTTFSNKVVCVLNNSNNEVIEGLELLYDYDSNTVTYMKDQYGNEGNYDFISYNDNYNTSTIKNNKFFSYVRFGLIAYNNYVGYDCSTIMLNGSNNIIGNNCKKVTLVNSNNIVIENTANNVYIKNSSYNTIGANNTSIYVNNSKGLLTDSDVHYIKNISSNYNTINSSCRKIVFNNAANNAIYSNVSNISIGTNSSANKKANNNVIYSNNHDISINGTYNLTIMPNVGSNNIYDERNNYSIIGNKFYYKNDISLANTLDITNIKQLNGIESVNAKYNYVDDVWYLENNVWNPIITFNSSNINNCSFYEWVGDTKLGDDYVLSVSTNSLVVKANTLELGKTHNYDIVYKTDGKSCLHKYINMVFDPQYNSVHLTSLVDKMWYDSDSIALHKDDPSYIRQLSTPISIECVSTYQSYFDNVYYYTTPKVVLYNENTQQKEICADYLNGELTLSYNWKALFTASISNKAKLYKDYILGIKVVNFEHLNYYATYMFNENNSASANINYADIVSFENKTYLTISAAEIDGDNILVKLNYQFATSRNYLPVNSDNENVPSLKDAHVILLIVDNYNPHTTDASVLDDAARLRTNIHIAGETTKYTFKAVQQGETIYGDFSVYNTIWLNELRIGYKAAKDTSSTPSYLCHVSNARSENTSSNSTSYYYGNLNNNILSDKISAIQYVEPS